MLLFVATAACLFAYFFIFSHETLMTFMFLFLHKFENDTIDEDLTYELLTEELSDEFVTKPLSVWDALYAFIFGDKE